MAASNRATPGCAGAPPDEVVVDGRSSVWCRTSWSWVMVHPVFWVSVVVLVVNDRVLKSSFPGLITGKLSDVAGVVMIALVLVALAGRVRWSLAVTAVLFALLKTVPVVAVWAAPVLGGRTLTDPTDLVGVAALVPLGCWLWARRERSSNQNGQVGRAWGTLATIGGVSVAVLATSATSCSQSPFGQLGVASDGTIIESAEDGTGRTRLLPIETDVPLPNTNSHGDYLVWEWSEGIDDVDLSPAETLVCTEDATCVEIRGLSIVEINPDGSETVVLDYNDRRGAINSQISSCGSELGEQFPDVASNGQVVVVAMGPLGAMVRTEDGTWVPTGIGDDVPSRAENAERNQAFEIIAWLLPFPIALASILFVALYPTRTGARTAGILIAALGWLGTMMVLFFWLVMLEGPGAVALVVSVAASFMILGSGLLLGLGYRKPRPGPMPPPQFY